MTMSFVRPCIVSGLMFHLIHSTSISLRYLGPVLTLVVAANGFLDSVVTTPHRFMSTARHCDETAMGVPNDLVEAGKSSLDELHSKPRSLRRQIPYVETFEEKTVRDLWEKDPFDGHKYVVNAVIIRSRNNNENRRSPILNCCDREPMHPLSLSGYEDSFDRIYQPFSTENESDSTRDNISGGGKNSLIEGATTASIAASPFAWTPPKNQKEEEKMQNFYLQVAYEGNAFCGWQTQLKNLVKPSVQRTLEEWLTVLQNNGHALEADIIVDAVKNADRKRERRLKKQGKRETKNVTKKDSRSENSFSTAPRIRWADLPVAGRTDAGVSAIGQVCRFRTHRKDLTAEMISDYLTNRITTAPEISQSLGITKIVKVSRSFHPTFSTSCRAYAYLIDVDTEHNSDCDGVLELFKGGRAKHQISLLDGMLQKLEGKALDYIGLSYGRVKTLNTICTLHHARAKLVRYETSAGAKSRARTAVCIELVGDRFLRRMVRLLVEASVRLVSTAEKNAETEPPVIGGIADCGATTDALLQLVEKRDRTIVGRPAPPDGLVFVGARLPLA